MRKTILVGTLLSILAWWGLPHPALAISLNPALPVPDCVNTVIAQLVSPDKLWNATTYQEFCAGGSAMETTVVDYVVINYIATPSNKGEVFDIDIQGNASLKPGVTWAAPHTLKISTYKANITLQKNSYSSIPISYSYK